MHWHISDGSQGGYMADSVETFDTRHEADAYAADLVRDYEDAAGDSYPDEAINVEEYPTMILVSYPDRTHDLGRIIERWECDECGSWGVWR